LSCFYNFAYPLWTACVPLGQWFPTTVLRNTSVLQSVPKCSSEKTNLTYFSVLFELFGL
jgi:hypothetical protein